MHIGLAGLQPVDELDAELERAHGFPDELRFVDAEQLVEERQVRHGGLADPDGADLFGFDQSYRMPGAEYLGQRGGTHPAGRAAAHDDDVLDALVRHGCLPGVIKRRSAG